MPGGGIGGVQAPPAGDEGVALACQEGVPEGHARWEWVGT